MLVLGIDPGTETTGYGILKLEKDGKPSVVCFDWIKTRNNNFPEKRLRQIYKGIKVVLEEYQPNVVAIERLFFFTNAKTAIRVSQAHGVFLLAAADYGIPVFEYTPRQVKKEITGNGRAQKQEIIKTILRMFKLRIPKGKKTYFDDVCDALAIALTHIRIQKGLHNASVANRSRT